MGSESLCFLYDPETKCQSATWLSPKKSKAQKDGLQKSWVKTMLTTLFDTKRAIHHEFVPENRTVNDKFYAR